MKETGYSFANVRVDLGRRTLLRDGKIVSLPARAFDLLVALIDRRDRVVSRHELMDLVWADVVVDDASLTQSVSVLRRAIGDASSILTVPGRGYQLTAEVRRDERAPTPSEPPVVSGRARRLIPLVAATLAILFVGVFAATAGRQGEKGGEDSVIAVLPIRSGDFSTPADADTLGLTNELIASLALMPGLSVRSSSSVLEFSEPYRDTPAEAGAQLGVAGVLVGYLRDSGRESVLVLQFIDVSRDAVLWSETVRGPSGEDDPTRSQLAHRAIDAAAGRFHVAGDISG